MSQVVLVNLDLNGNQILGLRIEQLAADPSGGSLYEGRLWYNTTTHILKYYSNSTVIPIGTGVASLTVDNSSIEDTVGGSTPSIRVKALGITDAMLAGSISNGKLATNPLARANHTGTQLAATISDLAAVVKAYRLDEFAVPTADINLNTHKLTNVVDPTSAQDAATKNYVDTFINGLAPKDNVRAATTANGTLASAFENGDAIDGVTLATGDRILLKNQTAGAENGIYTVNASGAPTRATDADASAELIGASVFVSEGTVNGNTLWVMTTDGPITVNTTALVFSQFGGPGAVVGGTGITVTGQSVAITVPVSVVNGGTGGITAAAARTSLVVPNMLAFDITGDGSATTFNVDHNMNTRDVMVQVRTASSNYENVITDVQRTTVNRVVIGFAVAPTNGLVYRVLVVGLA